MAKGKILRLPLPDRQDPGPTAPPRIIRGNPDQASAGEETVPRILRGSRAHFRSEPVDVELEALEPDFPLPPDPHVPDDANTPLDADGLRAEIEAEWKQKLEEAVLHVREEAFEAGYGAAREELLEATERTRRELGQDAEQLRRALDGFMESAEVRAVQLAIDAAEVVLGSPLSDRARAGVEQSLASAVEGLAGDGAIEVSLHPVDLLRIQESGFDAQLSAALPGLRWHPDDSLAEGDWSARSSQAVVRRVRMEMMDEIRARLGIEPAEGASL